MTGLQMQLAWKKVTKETHKRSKLNCKLNNINALQLGNLLLYAQILLSKIEVSKDTAFNEMIYKKTIRFYCTQMNKHV